MAYLYSMEGKILSFKEDPYDANRLLVTVEVEDRLFKTIRIVMHVSSTKIEKLIENEVVSIEDLLSK